MWSAIGAIGSTLLGGLFGKKKEKQTNEIDYVKLRDNAEKAGFNPLTALRAGGGAGFTTSTNHPALSSTIGDIAGQAFNAWANHDPMAEDRKSVEFDLMKAQLANIEADTTAKLRQGQTPRNSLNVPVREAPSVVTGTGLASTPATLGQPQAPEAGDRTVTNPWQRWEVEPTVSDGAVFEERYGDFVGGALGVLPAIRDLSKNAGKDYDAYIERRRKEREENKKRWDQQTAPLRTTPRHRPMTGGMNFGTSW